MISSRHIAKAVIALTEKDPGNTAHAEKIAEQLIQFVEKNHLQTQLGAIMRDIRVENEKIKKENSVSISVPHDIDAPTTEHITRFVGAPHGTQVTVTENPELLGGFLAYWRDQKIDGTIAHTLDTLRENILTA